VLQKDVERGPAKVMSLKILLSTPATGKTHACISRVREETKQLRGNPTWVILPDRYQVASFRRRLAEAGGAFGAQIGTFGTLYHEILRLAGKPVPLASDAVVQRLIRGVIEEALEEGQLSHFHNIAGKPGFLSVLRDRFGELKRAQVQPETFLKFTAKQDSTLQELASLYEHYQKQLRGLGWADPEGLNWLAVAALEEDPDLCAEWPLLVVDGFDSFHGSQLSALKLLGDRVPQLLITTPGDPENDRTAFRRFKRSFENLYVALPEAVIERLEGDVRLPAPLAQFEAGLFEQDPTPIQRTAHITQLEARTTADEAREALRWVKARIVRDGIRAQACAIVTPNPELYRPLLREAALEFGLPLRFTHGDPLPDAPGITALLELLTLPLLNWPRRGTLDAISCPYFDLGPFGFNDDDTIALDELSLNGQIIEGLDEWSGALERLAAGGGGTRRSDDEATRWPNLPRGEKARVLLEALKAFSNRIQPPDPRTTKEWVAWLEDLLEELSFFQRCETLYDRAAALEFREVLRALVLGEVVAGERETAYGVFILELRSALDSAYFEKKLDWQQPSILVLQVLNARGLRFKAVAVLGLSEGLFPEVEREDPFFSDAAREALGLEPRLGREQTGLFYQVVTRADQFLLLTRPYLAEDGEYWQASPFWRAAAASLSDDPQRVRSEEPRSLVEAGSPEELLFWGVRRGALPPQYKALQPRWERLRSARDVLAVRQAREADGDHEGDLSSIIEHIRKTYGPDHVWSSSRLESYGTCPFFFLSASALKLDPRDPPEPGYDAAQLGLVLHAVLEEVYPAVEDPTDTAAVLRVLHEIAEAAFAEAPEKYGFRPTALWALEQQELFEILKVTIEALGDASAGWRPYAYEQVFGLQGKPVLRIALDGGDVLVRGVIDRVDRNAEGEVRILDYKTGGSHLTKNDLISGRRLQLAIYAMGARDALGLGEPVEGIYWTIRGAKAGGLKLGSFKAFTDEGIFEGPEGAMELARMHVDRFVEGVRSGNYAPAAPEGGCPPYCPVVGWCWRYREGWG